MILLLLVLLLLVLLLLILLLLILLLLVLLLLILLLLILLLLVLLLLILLLLVLFLLLLLLLFLLLLLLLFLLFLLFLEGFLEAPGQLGISPGVTVARFRCHGISIVADGEIQGLDRFIERRWIGCALFRDLLFLTGLCFLDDVECLPVGHVAAVEQRGCGQIGVGRSGRGFERPCRCFEIARPVGCDAEVVLNPFVLWQTVGCHGVGGECFRKLVRGQGVASSHQEVLDLDRLEKRLALGVFDQIRFGGGGVLLHDEFGNPHILDRCLKQQQCRQSR